jgi:UDP-GlcNAc:undecaprenyl-phosphate/decaprenyl-phosphate GlcNAc-1-phosphate transferase
MEPIYTAWEVLQNVWWVGLVGLGASLIVTPIVRAIAYRAKIVDRPDDLLKPHARPIAYLGGIGIYAGLLAGLIAFVVSWDQTPTHVSALSEALSSPSRWYQALVNPLWNLGGIALASFVIMLVGLLDDILDISPRKKILGQIVAAGLLLLGGVGDRMANVLFVSLPWQPPIVLLLLISAFMCLVLVICTCNATNLLDGLDGLAGGVTGIIALGFLALAVWMAMWAQFPASDAVRVSLCLAMAGAVLGFLPYNIPPASIFMGDAGSMLLGFFVATMMAMFCTEGSPRWLLAAMVVFALPILDTSLAVVRRLLSGKPVFAGDRSHLYDQLVDRGMKVPQVVGLFYILAAVAAIIGVATSILFRGRWALLIYAVLFVAVWLVFVVMGMLHPEKHDPHESDSE